VQIKHRQNFNSFISPAHSSVSYEVQHSFLTSDVARNDFFKKIFITVIQKFAIRYNNLGTRFLSTRTSGGFRLECFVIYW